MANYNKQFNFRNGVQVDNDNLVVSPTGLVGIGTDSDSKSGCIVMEMLKSLDFSTSPSLFLNS